MWGIFKRRKIDLDNALASLLPADRQEIRSSGWQMQNGDLVHQYRFVGGGNDGMWWQIRCLVDQDSFIFLHVVASIQLVRGETWLVGSLRDEADLVNSPFSTVQATDLPGSGTLINFTDRAAIDRYISVLRTARSMDFLLLDKQRELARVYFPNDPYAFQASFALYYKSTR